MLSYSFEHATSMCFASFMPVNISVFVLPSLLVHVNFSWSLFRQMKSAGLQLD